MDAKTKNAIASLNEKIIVWTGRNALGGDQANDLIALVRSELNALAATLKTTN